MKKNVPRHILAPRRGCFSNHLPLRRVRILAERFCMIERNFLSYKNATQPFSPQRRSCVAKNSLTGKIYTRFWEIWQYLFFEGCSLTHSRIQDLLADTQVLRSYLKQLIGIDKLQALLQAHDLLRNQL